MNGFFNEKKRYNSLSDYLKNRFGQKVYKLSLDAGMTCPNRDGCVGSRGCIFCSEGGSGDFAEKLSQGTDLAIQKAKARVAAKGASRFIAYLQSYTNTYAPVSRLEQLFLPIILREDICALSIATRPDCLPGDVVQLLARLNKIKPVFVELGLQTVHPKTADYIRRGYSLDLFDSALKNLKQNGLNTVVHVILGLPGESREQMLQTVDYVGRSGVDGIKLQLLHVLKNTDLAAEYQAGKFKTLEMQDYFSLLAECLQILPPTTIIHRLTGDAPKKLLISPQWSANKKEVLNRFKRYLEENDVVQSSKFTP